MNVHLNPIVWRELKINLLNIGRLITTFLVPIFTLIFFGFMFAKNIGIIPYENIWIRYDQFFLPGILTLQIFMYFSNTFSHVRLDREKRVVALIITSKTSIDSYFLGKIIANTFIMILKICLLIFIGHLLVGIAIPFRLINMFTILISVILGTVIWVSFGFTCGVFINREDIRDIIFSLLTFPLTFASSIYYNINLGPAWIRVISSFNPLTYICNLMRKGFFLEKVYLLNKDLMTLLFFALFSFILAYVSSRRLSL